jgi:hypothetical protein
MPTARHRLVSLILAGTLLAAAFAAAPAGAASLSPNYVRDGSFEHPAVSGEVAYQPGSKVGPWTVFFNPVYVDSDNPYLTARQGHQSIALVGKICESIKGLTPSALVYLRFYSSGTNTANGNVSNASIVVSANGGSAIYSAHSRGWQRHDTTIRVDDAGRVKLCFQGGAGSPDIDTAVLRTTPPK